MFVSESRVSEKARETRSMLRFNFVTRNEIYVCIYVLEYNYSEKEIGIFLSPPFSNRARKFGKRIEIVSRARIGGAKLFPH